MNRSWISGTSRSVTMVGAIIGAIFLIVGQQDTREQLRIQQEQLKLQRESWVAEHQPKLSFELKSVEHNDDTLRVTITEENSGEFATSDAEHRLLLHRSRETILYSIPEKGFRKKTNTDAGKTLGRPFLFPTTKGYSKETVYLSYTVQYRWLGIDSLYTNKVYFLAYYDSATNRYDPRSATLEHFPE